MPLHATVYRSTISYFLCLKCPKNCPHTGYDTCIAHNRLTRTGEMWLHRVLPYAGDVAVATIILFSD